MTEVWFIRHGESIANRGAATETAAEIPLTELGHRQAATVAGLLQKAPDLIVTSPFFRTQQTAAPARARFPQTPHETWAIQEFSYLDSERHKNTNARDRAPFAAAYWEKNDVSHRDSDTCESFADLLARVQDTVKKIEQSPHGFIAVYSHGLFMHTLELALSAPDLPPQEVMKRISHIRVHSHMPNAHIIKARVQAGKLVLSHNDNKPSKGGPKWSRPSPR